MLLKSSKICESNFRRKRRKRRQAEKQSSLFFVKVRLSEHVALTIVSLFRPHFVRPYESLRRRKPTSFIARRCLAPLSVAFSSFVKTKFCRIFPIQTTASFLMLPFIARQVLSLAPPLSPKLVSASLPHFGCFIFNKKNSRHNCGNFYRFCGFLIRFLQSVGFLILRDSKLLRNPKCSAFCFKFYPLEKIHRNLFR